MKKILYISLLLVVSLSGCTLMGNGELTGVPNREEWFSPDPYGMLFIPMGSYNMGPSDQDVPYANTAQAKTVSVQAFWMDETEVTNNEYRQFVYWVRDSIAYKLLGDQIETYLMAEDEYGEEIDPPFINWDEMIDWHGEEEREILEEMYLPANERFYRRKVIDTRKLNYEYFWIDFRQAAKKFTHNGINAERSYNYDEQKYEGNVINFSVEKDGNKVKRDGVGKVNPVKDRSSYIMKEIVNVYPDTLCWVSDFTYSFNEPMTNMYFWHPAYDHYPVVGVSWKQATAFSNWRTQLMNGYLAYNGETFVQDYRLPKESEWEYAARGGLPLSMYPWGGYYTRNYTGCFIANFKPLRGNYVDDGGFHTVIVANYDPNEFGLYDMAGNVSEWTANAFDEAAYSFMDDLNPDYSYDALPSDLPAKKRKVLRGGSWKDIAYYLQCGTRTYEYQDTAKSYIGFRCVRTFLGRDKADMGSTSQVY
ncbi:MAG TPA: gliding motility-associated lipoprotein [Bacteroidales bacterium]|nr:MAG: gliding motility-associated lipoprotein [Bacteroidetes bacterium GWF2_33_38]OFY67924.1 MAG: gliding motility-associated lipoprotein [Bacteroidetes bacterium RIFOXYA12_FULL_33_9]OFY85276.1 MAG: gliding motility-associated lipoprotein [Bacteroidetes bacterium RIFOXYA2_FULL_33_7]HBF87474.1 gliding motility-associated lipoprotein [Bacteroidales bacterium]